MDSAKRPRRLASPFINAPEVMIPNRSGPSLFGLYQTPDVPFVSDEQISHLQVDPPGSVTRHMKPGHLESAKRGYFQFGTLEIYGASPAESKNRLGDSREGNTVVSYKARSGDIRAAVFGNMFLHNVRISGFENDVTVITRANDYVSCSSVGPFLHERAEVIRANDNSELACFVTYDLAALKKAILDVLLENEATRNLSWVGRRVLYGNRDAFKVFEGSGIYWPTDDHMQSWVNIAFVKHPDYTVEEEYRILLFDRSRAGRLAEKTDYLKLQDERIARAIVASGAF